MNEHYNDTGLYGIHVKGVGGKVENMFGLLKILYEEFLHLEKPVPDIELNRSKNILKMNILMALENAENRAEEMVRNYSTYGKLTFHTYCADIDKVTSEDIQRVAS